MFQTEDDEILVNEVALSHTIQVIILLGQVTLLNSKITCVPFLIYRNTDSKVAGIMVNLVGEEGFSGQVV
jgi:5-(carboxyamino)imidazole ribonucleotide synthase